jgi:hypothetical protein
MKECVYRVTHPDSKPSGEDDVSEDEISRILAGNCKL